MKGHVLLKDGKLIFPKAHVLRKIIKETPGKSKEEIIQEVHLRRKNKYTKIAKAGCYAYEKLKGVPPLDFPIL